MAAPQTYSALLAEQLHRKFSVEDRRDGKGRQTRLHFVVECFEDLFGEEAIERLW